MVEIRRIFCLRGVALLFFPARKKWRSGAKKGGTRMPHFQMLLLPFFTPPPPFADVKGEEFLHISAQTFFDNLEETRGGGEGGKGKADREIFEKT